MFEHHTVETYNGNKSFLSSSMSQQFRNFDPASFVQGDHFCKQSMLELSLVDGMPVPVD